MMKVMDLYELMETEPEELAQLKYEKLKEHTLRILVEIKDLIENDAFNEIRKKLIFNPAGDYMGTSHCYIDFDYGNGEMDLNEIINLLEFFKNKSK